MLERLLRLAAIGCSLVVVAGWVAFAVPETSAASRAAAAGVEGAPLPPAATAVSPGPGAERRRERLHGDVHEAIDDADDVLLTPFRSLGAGSGDPWAAHTLPALAALLAYGVGLGFLARFSRGRA